MFNTCPKYNLIAKQDSSGAIDLPSCNIFLLLKSLITILNPNFLKNSIHKSL